MSKHTPGPWRYDAENHVVWGPKCTVKGHSGDNRYYSEPDMLLIAAAPEILAALRDILTVADRFDEHSPEGEHARALLARLDGGK